MQGFDLPENFTSNLEALLRKTKTKFKRVPKVVLEKTT
jgi:hypothetical protein